MVIKSMNILKLFEVNPLFLNRKYCKLLNYF